ncbi:MAG TPA: hypothetical protein VMY05_00650 [Acidobacteriota bacterium]|nr:hypothetical protein [Acidobacteriota bacterium]
MTYVPPGGAGGAAIAAAIAQATKASGAIVKLDPAEFVKILNRIDSPLVVTARGGFLGKKFNYLTSYKGLFFYTSSPQPIQYPSKTEFVAAKKIWVPN